MQKSNNTKDKINKQKIQDILKPIIKMSELLRIPVDYVDETIKGDKLVKAVNQLLIRKINKGDIEIPISIYFVFEQLDNLDYDLLLIFNSMNELDEKYRNTLYLAHFKKMTEREMATTRQTSQSSVHRLKKVAYLQLAEKLDLNC